MHEYYSYNPEQLSSYGCFWNTRNKLVPDLFSTTYKNTEVHISHLQERMEIRGKEIVSA